MIKPLFPLLVILMTVALGEAQQNDGIKVSITIEGVKNEEGSCRLLVFESKKGFPDSREIAVLQLNSTIRNTSAEFSFELRPGRYAVSVIHDKNSNGKLDKTWYGKPLEGFGILNNPKVDSRPPEFEESSARIDRKNNRFTIRLTYL